MQWINDLAKLAKEHNIPLHMDGARLFNAVIQSKVPANEICKDFNSVCFSLSKNLGVPLGSILVGTKSFIQQ